MRNIPTGEDAFGNTIQLWIMKQLSEQTPSDMVAVAGLRHMFEVSTNLKLFLLFQTTRGCSLKT